jgi:hypothetical protein
LGGLDGFGKRRSRRRRERRVGGWEEKRECGFRASLILLGDFFAEFPSLGFEGRKRFFCFDFWVVVCLFVGAAGGTRSIISSSSSSRRREKKNPSVIGGELEVENGPPSCCCFGGVEKACRRPEERQSGEKSIRGLVREEEEEEKEESGLARERERETTTTRSFLDGETRCGSSVPLQCKLLGGTV